MSSPPLAAAGTVAAVAEPPTASPAPDSQHSVNEQTIGLILAVSSSIFIGASFIVKKRGLRLAGSQGIRAGAGGFSYLLQPIWWAGMLAMVVGEAANFAAYAFAPAILVTPLGALSIIISAILAHVMLQEKLNLFGILGCVLCITGSVTIALHAPPEVELTSVVQVWELAMAPGFVAYAFLSVTAIILLIWHVGPQHGQSNIFVYLSICSIAGSLSVMSCKALGVAIKLTAQGANQLQHPQTYLSAMVVAACVVTQMNYLNKALDLFNTAIVSPVYYVMFTLLTILASIILFRDIQSPLQIVTEMCGFVTIVIGTLLLHTTRDMDIAWADIARMSRDSELRLAALNARDRKAYLLGEEMMPLPLAGDDGDGGLAGGADGVSGSALDKPGHMSRKAAGTTIRIAKA